MVQEGGELEALGRLVHLTLPLGSCSKSSTPDGKSLPELAHLILDPILKIFDAITNFEGNL